MSTSLLALVLCLRRARQQRGRSLPVEAHPGGGQAGKLSGVRARACVRVYVCVCVCVCVCVRAALACSFFMHVLVPHA
jgi:hypothetical protein